MKILIKFATLSLTASLFVQRSQGLKALTLLDTFADVCVSDYQFTIVNFTHIIYRKTSYLEFRNMFVHGRSSNILQCSE